MPDPKALPTFSSARSLVADLKNSANQRDLERGKLLHLAATQAGVLNNLYVANTLILMYTRCGDVHQARYIFDFMTFRDVVSWNVLILGYVENGESFQALEMFDKMDCMPNRGTFLAVLKACTGLGRVDKETGLQRGKMIHRLARQFGFDRDVAVASTLVDMYCRNGNMQQARYVFDGMKLRDTVSWNVLILGYVQNGQSEVAMEVFSKMDLVPNRGTFVAGLKACTGLKNEIDRMIHLHNLHEKTREFGLDKDVIVGSSLMDVYIRSGDMSKARSIFDRLISRDVASWNVLIRGYVENGENQVALEAFSDMDCQPNYVTFVAALQACMGLNTKWKLVSSPTCLENGVFLHKQARKLGFDKVVIVANTLMDMYFRCGEIFQARKVFEEINHKDVVSWTTLINGNVENEQPLVALDVFDNMDCVPNGFTLAAVIKACSGLAASRPSDKKFWIQKGIAFHKTAAELGFVKDVVVASSLVGMYSKFGDMLRARDVFDGMKLRTVVTWNALLLGYVENGLFWAALDVFDNMDCGGDPLTFVGALRACGSVGGADAGRRIHAQVCHLGWKQDEMVATSLVDFYGKCGNMDAAERVFNEMQCGNTQSWTALIGGYSSCGNTSRVFGLVKEMVESEVQMNGVTMQLVLAACSHAGLVEEGQRYFKSMSKYGLVPNLEHYTCMVDMLGRASTLEVALSMVKSMPMRGDTVLWKAMLAACTKFRNFKVGELC